MIGRGDRERSRPRDRGQATIDFGIGASLFVITVAFVLAFTPILLQPFLAGSQTGYVSADRVADQLSTDLLVAPDNYDPDTPYVLDKGCTDAFFGGTFPNSDCRYGGSDAQAAVGFPDYRQLNVTLQNSDTGAMVLDLGDPAPVGTGTVSTASRLVVYEDRTHELIVRVW